MSRIYTREKRIAQSIPIISLQDLERINLKAKKRSGRHSRIASERIVERTLARPRKRAPSHASRTFQVPHAPIDGTHFFVFVGEWGYEILSSHGWLRGFKARCPEARIGIASRAGVEFLYEDAYDVYVDISDILAKYRSSMFGTVIKREDRERIEKRCFEAIDGKCDGIHFSNAIQGHRSSIMYGRPLGRGTRVVRDPNFLGQQLWKQLTLKSLKAEKEEVEKAFPGLLSSSYIIVQDRRRSAGWGQASFSASAWKEILSSLVADGYKPVLIGYKLWKVKDATSIFYEKEFRDLPSTVNVSDFLTKHLKRNLAYQAILFKHAQFWLGIWGSASMLPPLLGRRSYVLSAGRGSTRRQQRDVKAWEKIFARCGGSITYINTTLKASSAIDGIRKFISRKSERPVSPSSKKDRVAVVSLCWNRFYYTQRCLKTLWDRAGMEFDHFIIDNGSTDGTIGWLKDNEKMFKKVIVNPKNLGIGIAKLQTLKLIEEGQYKWFIAGPNDAEVLTDDFIVKMLEFWNLTKGKYMFAPEFTGTKHVAKVVGRFKIGNFNAQQVDSTGGVYRACSIFLFRDYITKATEWNARDFYKFAKKRGVGNLYIPDLQVKHVERTWGQMRRYPNMKVGYNRVIGRNPEVPMIEMKKEPATIPFMTFITRCYKRPKALQLCKASIEAQIDKDYEHIFIEDTVGRGIGWANKQFHVHRHRVKGKYVYIVDDDTKMIDPQFVETIKKIVSVGSPPDVIMVKMNMGDFKEYPLKGYWGKYPVRAKIAGGCICVSNQVFQKHIVSFGHLRAGDFHFIKSIFDHGGYKIQWLDRVVKYAVRSRGKAEKVL